MPTYADVDRWEKKRSTVIGSSGEKVKHVRRLTPQELALEYVVDGVTRQIYRAASAYDEKYLANGSRGRVKRYLRDRLLALARVADEDHFHREVEDESYEIMLLAGYLKTERGVVFEERYRLVVETAVAVGAASLSRTL